MTKRNIDDNMSKRKEAELLVSFSERYTAVDLQSVEAASELPVKEVVDDSTAKNKIILSNDAYALGELLEKVAERLELLTNTMRSR